MNPAVVQILTDRDRSILTRLRKRAQENNISPSKVQPSYLRVSMLADASKSTYDFQTKKDVGQSLLHDRKLDQNDSFVMTWIGLKLLGEAPLLPGTGLLQTYPNNIVFPAAAGEVTPAHLNIFYNAGYEIKVKETVYADYIPTEDMLCVRTTQQSAAGNFSERFNKDGLVQLTPDITLNGSEKNSIKLMVPTFAGLEIQNTTAATRIYVTFIAYGFLIAGGSNLGNLSN